MFLQLEKDLFCRDKAKIFLTNFFISPLLPVELEYLKRMEGKYLSLALTPHKTGPLAEDRDHETIIKHSW